MSVFVNENGMTSAPKTAYKARSAKKQAKGSKVATSDEGAIQAAICGYLALKKYLFWRSNNTPSMFIDKNGRRQFRKMGKYALKGIPDIIVVVAPGYFCGIEVKATNGKQSDDQKAFQEACEDRGGTYILATSLDDVASIL